MYYILYHTIHHTMIQYTILYDTMNSGFCFFGSSQGFGVRSRVTRSSTRSAKSASTTALSTLRLRLPLPGAALGVP